VDTFERAAFHAAIENTPNDALVYLVFADWLEERGETEEAAKYRSPLPRVAALAAKIEKELDRLDSMGTGNGGCLCVADPNLPDGWVRVYDGTADAYGLATEILAALEAVEHDPDAVVQYELTWEALADFADSPPNSTRDWPEELWDSEQVEEGDINDNPYFLISVKTNAGEQWAFGPHGVSECALSTALRYDALYKTRQDALDSDSEWDGHDAEGEESL
jgi:uncharacterized protein (TIGR02996 family)